MLVSARNTREVHQVELPLTEEEFYQQCEEFVRKYHAPPTSFIIPVYNEERNLPHFMASLEHTTNRINSPREFIFVLNGCTDNSGEIIRRYMKGSRLKMKLIECSQRGIVPAFVAGIANRDMQGYVGKIDADILLHPHTLDLLIMDLTQNPQSYVTYAEPFPIDSVCVYNQVEHNPPLRSRRLYIHGRTSLYRDDPFSLLTDRTPLEKIQVEDIFLSFFFAYFLGLDSIRRCPHAIIYSKTVKSLEDLAIQTARVSLELERIFNIYPPFRILKELLTREIYSSQYLSLLDGLDLPNDKSLRNDVWPRLSTTK